METVIIAIGVVFIVIGALYIIKPSVLKSVLNFFTKGKLLYFSGLSKIAIAILFFLGARECDVTWAIVLFGVMSLFSGMLVFTLGLEKIKKMLIWYNEQSHIIMRLVGAVSLVYGILIVYCA